MSMLAIGLFAVNAMAVISYSDVLLAEGSEAASGQHILRGTLLAFPSLDYLLNRKRF